MDPTNRNTALASALAEELARCGVRRAAISPGSRSTPLALALWRQPAIEVTVLLDERCAGFFALGCALSTGVPAAVVCTSGTAAANLHPAVAEAAEASVPLIVLTADRPPELRGIGAGQTIDQLKLYGDAPRWFCEVGTHEADDAGLLHLRSVACRAYAAAVGDPRPGPAHLNLSWRDPLHPVPAPGDVTATDPLALEGRGERPLTAVARTAPEPEPVLLDELAARIARAPRGLILAGRQGDAALGEPLADLAEAAGWPVLAEPLSQLRWGRHDRSRMISHYDLIARSAPPDLAPALVVRFGEMPTSKALRAWLGGEDGPDQIVIDSEGAWKEPSRRAGLSVRASAPATAAALAERLKAAAASPERAMSEWPAAWRRADEAAAGAIRAELGEERELSEPGAIRALSRHLDDGDLVLAASSMPVRDLEAFLPAGRAQVRFVANRGANGIDGLASTAAGAVSASGARGWAVLGDLAVVHDLGGLAAVRGASRLRLLVLDNGGGGIFHFLPQAQSIPSEEFEALLGTPSGVDLSRAAELFGLSAAVAADAGELDDALAGNARVVIARTDRAANAELHRRVSAAADRAVADALSA